MRRFLLSVTLLVVLPAAVQAGPVTSLDDVDVWVGTGSNRAAFVVDWRTGTGTSSFVWGYRWDGTATGEDMLRALAASDTGLYGTVGYFGPGLGYALFGIGFDLNRDGNFGVTPPLTFAGGIATQNRDNDLDDNRTAADPGDYYHEGWWEGYWSYWVKPGAGANWEYSSFGMSNRPLTDGSWDGWTFAKFAEGFGFEPAAPFNPPAAVGSAVPAPATGVLALIAAPVLVVARRRSRRAESLDLPNAA